jgi:hypothetical protein
MQLYLVFSLFGVRDRYFVFCPENVLLLVLPVLQVRFCFKFIIKAPMFLGL